MAQDSEGKRVIVVCIDDSEFAEEAFNYYAREVKGDNDYVVLVHIPELYNFSWASPAVVDQLLNELTEKIKKLEEKYNKKVIDELKVPGKFKTGEGKKPGEVICDIAKHEKARMIVIGSRGLGSFRRKILGSVSDYVAHHSHVPVLICKHDKDQEQQQS